MNEKPSYKSSFQAADALEVSSAVKRARSSGWQLIGEEKLAYAIVFVEVGYSHVRAADKLGISYDRALVLQRDPMVQACVQDIQEQAKGVSFLNEAWIDAKIMEMMPMAMGEVAVPTLDPKTGEEINVHKFMPEIAIRLLDLKAPKKTEVKTPPPVSAMSSRRLQNMETDELERLLDITEKLNQGDDPANP